MAKPYDDSLKYLVRANPRAFVLWLLSSAQFVAQRPYELKNWKMEMDSLIEVLVNGMPMLLHIEFQTHHDDEMDVRILRYNVLAHSEYNLPVLSIVIYLLKDDQAPISPMIWTMPSGQEILRFHYESITLADLPSEALLKLQEAGLLPLLPLTSDGASREMIELMRTELLAADKPELVQVGYTLASLAFKEKGTPADQHWLIRKVHEMRDILYDTPVYQEILKEGREEGIEKGLEKGRQEGLEKGLEKGHLEGRQEGLEKGHLEGLRQAVITIVLERFPKLARLAKKQLAVVEDALVLQHVLVKMSIAPTIEEAQQHLLALDDDEDN